jgi:hypothetical protein
MHFTLLFKSFSLSANFVPCLVWTSSSHVQCDFDKQNWIPHNDFPHYKKGDLLEAILHFSLDCQIDNRLDKILVIVHESSQCGEESDLNQLIEDCKSMAQDVQVISPWDPQDPMYKYLFMQKVGIND